MRSINQFEEGINRILVTTDVMARGMDLEKISHVFNFDTPVYPENYMHRIGRTEGQSRRERPFSFTQRRKQKPRLESRFWMNYEIPVLEFPEEVEISDQLIPEERPKEGGITYSIINKHEGNSGFHEKKAKNMKTNQGGSYKRKIEKKYKKPQDPGR